MVLRALRGANSIVAAAPAVVSQSTVPPQVQTYAPSFDHSFVGAAALFDVTSAEAPSFEHEARPPIPFETPDPVKFNFYEDEEPVDRIHVVERDSPASRNGSSRQPEALVGFDSTISTTDHDYAESGDHSLSAQPSAVSELTVESSDERATVEETRTEERPSSEADTVEAGAVMDPWQAPLAPWDYSRSEWPVLVGPARQRSFRKLRTVIAAVVVLASAAGFYFLVYRQSTPQPRAATDTGTTAQVSTVEPRAAAIGSADSGSLAPTAPTQADRAAVATSQPSAVDAVTTNDNSAQGQFSLQAAAFPTQQGADEFAEKLKRAGVPSFVVPADLVRRGRWFRVRVGRFNSAESAQKFAGEAQQRARAAGLAVQLIVCQYDQP